MARSLVIVESPAKAKTINKYLGRNYTVKASIGHVWTCPRRRSGFVCPAKKKATARRKRRKKKGAKGRRSLKRSWRGSPHHSRRRQDFRAHAADHRGQGQGDSTICARPRNSADAVYLAGDPDREGEAISAHLAMVLAKPSKFTEQEPSASRFKKKEVKSEAAEEAAPEAPKKEIPATDPKKIFRVTFNEITPKAIARRSSIPAGGYEPGGRATGAARSGPHRGLQDFSAAVEQGAPRTFGGRVQTVALRLIVERERKSARSCRRSTGRSTRMLDAGEPPAFEAKLAKHKGEEIAVHNASRGGRGSWPRWKRPSGRWPAWRKRKRGAMRRRRSPLPSCSRPPTTACATPPSAPCRWRSGCMKAWNWAKKARWR
jgi:DNA topoisomerase IA